MKEKSIFLRPIEIEALLNNAKTQVRRVMKIQPPEYAGKLFVERFHPVFVDRNGEEQPGEEIFGAFNEGGEWGLKSPYGEPGDRLWVREVWAEAHYWTTDEEAETPLYRVGDIKTPRKPVRWRSPVTMSRSASRIALEIVGIRVARLSDISEADAVAEGFDNSQSEAAIAIGWYEKPKRAYRRFWEQTHGDASWKANPWVWVVEFKMVEKG